MIRYILRKEKILREIFQILLICIFLLTTHLVSADMIHLKSGKILKGEIVEKTDEYMRINIRGISIKYYQDEIDSVDEEYLENGQIKDIKKDFAVITNKNKIKEPSVDNPTESNSDQESPDNVSEDETEAEIDTIGSISGTIILPEVEKQGNLFISFSSPGEIINEPGPNKDYYIIIKSQEIKLNKVNFKIKDIPDGSYQGFATWDTNRPFWEPSWGEGNCPGYTGDYVGETNQEVIISGGQDITNLTFECQNLIIPKVPTE